MAKTLRKQAEESSSIWAAAQVVVKQLQDVAKKTSDLPDLLNDLQEDQEDDYITDNESLDKEAELIGSGWGIEWDSARSEENSSSMHTRAKNVNGAHCPTANLLAYLSPHYPTVTLSEAA